MDTDGELVGVNTFLTAFDALLGGLRVALFASGLVVAALAGLSYAVRTRRINPFSAVARLTRGSIDPLFAPVERRVVRAGGRPTMAPWWALGAIVLAGIILISALGFIRQQIGMAGAAVQLGGRGLAMLAIAWTFGLLQLALFVRVISSWIRVSPYSPWLRWSYALTDWIINPLRTIIPQIGMIDITPIAAYFLISIVERLVIGLL